jgi:hypothetical protein
MMIAQEFGVRNLFTGIYKNTKTHLGIIARQTIEPEKHTVTQPSFHRKLPSQNQNQTTTSKLQSSTLHTNIPPPARRIPPLQRRPPGRRRPLTLPTSRLIPSPRPPVPARPKRPLDLLLIHRNRRHNLDPTISRRRSRPSIAAGFRRHSHRLDQRDPVLVVADVRARRLRVLVVEAAAAEAAGHGGFAARGAAHDARPDGHDQGADGGHAGADDGEVGFDCGPVADGTVAPCECIVSVYVVGW